MCFLPAAADFLPCFLLEVVFFSVVGLGALVAAGEAAGAGAGKGRGVLFLGSDDGAGRGVAESSCGAESRFRMIRPLPSLEKPAKEMEVMTDKKRMPLMTKYMA